MAVYLSRLYLHIQMTSSKNVRVSRIIKTIARVCPYQFTGSSSMRGGSHLASIFDFLGGGVSGQMGAYALAKQGSMVL